MFIPHAWCIFIHSSGRKDANGRILVPAESKTRLDLDNQAETGTPEGPRSPEISYDPEPLIFLKERGDGRRWEQGKQRLVWFALG